MRTVGPNQIRRVNAVIDRHPHPAISWKRIGSSMASEISKIAWSGLGDFGAFAKPMLRLAENGAMNYLGKEALSVGMRALTLL
jgi:hypothetical protein